MLSIEYKIISSQQRDSSDLEHQLGTCAPLPSTGTGISTATDTIGFLQLSEDGSNLFFQLVRS